MQETCNKIKSKPLSFLASPGVCSTLGAIAGKQRERKSLDSFSLFFSFILLSAEKDNL